MLPSGVLTPTYDGFRTGSYCGLIQADGWTLEILPKIYDGTHHAPDRGLLVRMLGACFDVPVWLDGIAKSNLADDLLTVVIGAFLDEAQQQLRQGWIKSYVTKEERLTRPRGRLNLIEQLRRGRANAHQILCEFDELTVNNSFNQVVRTALVLSRHRLLIGSRLAVHAYQLDLALSDVDTLIMALVVLDHLPHHRLMQRYERLLMLSSWLLRLLGPDVHGGQEAGLELIFDMNSLFEDYVAGALESSIRRHPFHDRLKLTREQPSLPLVQDAAGTGRFKMKPDFILWLDDKILAILDTKWKRLRPDLQEHTAKILQADMYQLLAYGHIYQCERLVLIYPDHPILNGWPLPRFRYCSEEPINIHLNISTCDLNDIDSTVDQIVNQQLEGAGKLHSGG